MSDTTSGHFTIQTNQKDILTNSRVGEMKILKRRLPSLRHSWYYQIIVILFSPCGFLDPKDLKLTFFIFEFQIFGFERT